MTRTLRRGASAAALLPVLLSACTSGPAQDASLVVSSDPELRAAVTRLLPDVAARSGLELRDPVRVERRGSAELDRYLRARLEEELPAEEAALVVRSYGLLGLVPEDLELRDLLLSVYTEQVAGFYDPDSTALFVMEGTDPAGLDAILVHELVHAVQDQHARLDSITGKERGNDGRAAAHAAIEGHAMMVMLEHLTEQLQGSSVDLSELPDFAETSRPVLAAMADVFPALAAAPRVVREGLLFPYIEGASYVHALWRTAEGRPAPLGEHLPRSTRHVLQPEAALAAGLPAPPELRIGLPDGVVELYGNDLGQLEAGILLEELGEPRAGASGLRADRFALVEQPGGTTVLYWVSLWDDAPARDRFLDALRRGTARLPAPAAAEPVEIDGEPGVLFRSGVGADDDVELRIGSPAG